MRPTVEDAHDGNRAAWPALTFLLTGINIFRQNQGGHQECEPLVG